MEGVKSMGLGCENMTKIWENGVGCSRFFEKNERGRGREGEVGGTRNPRGGGELDGTFLKWSWGSFGGKKEYVLNLDLVVKSLFLFSVKMLDWRGVI